MDDDWWIIVTTEKKAQIQIMDRLAVVRASEECALCAREGLAYQVQTVLTSRSVVRTLRTKFT